MYILYYSEKSFQTFSPTLSTLVNQNYCEQNEQSTSNLEYPHCLGVTHYHPLVQQYKYDCKDGLIKHVKTHDQVWTSDGRVCDYPDCKTNLRSLSL